jgi:phytoene desaturase
MQKTIVAGAGIGGLVSAIYLARAGHDVTVYEKNSIPGGKIDEVFIDGFRFDLGAALLTMPEIFLEFFNDIGEKADDHFKIIRLDKSCKYFWSDGTVFNAYCDKGKLFNELEQVFGEQEKEGFKSFLNYAKLFYDLLRESFLKGEFKLRNYFTARGVLNFTKFISGKSINDLSNKFFKNKKLRQLINRSSIYNGSSPYLSPQLFSIIPFVEYEFGSWYVKGGIYKITETLTALCKKYGVEINTGFELTDLKDMKKKITELTFKNEYNVDTYVRNFDKLICNFTNNEKLVYDKYLDNFDWSSSGFLMLMGLDKKFEMMDRHNIFFSDDYENEYIDIFEKKIPSDDMTIYISISSKIDVKDAPEGCENWYIYVIAPYLSDNFEWTDRNKNEYMDKVIQKMESFLYPDSSGTMLKDHIKFCKIYSPADFKEKYNSEYGAIYGLSCNSLYTLMKRPPNRSKKFDNLFFVGGNTLPGGGVPLCFLSGKMISKIT